MTVGRTSATRRQFLTASGLTGAALMLTACAGSTPARVAPALLEPNVSTSYEAAIAAAQAMIGADAANPLIEPEALPLLLTHGRRTAKSVVLLHGFTNCPKQFVEFAHVVFRSGCNVFVPRLPQHGYRDRLTRALSQLTVPELQAAAQNATTIAAGLGERVVAMGLSLGGTLACWTAQTQPIELAISLAPFLTPHGYSQSVGNAIANVLYAIPDMYWWWDLRIREKSLPLYAYPGYPTHALAELIFLGETVFGLAHEGAPRAKKFVLITNATDPAINIAVPRALLATWQKSAGPHYREVVWTNITPPRHDVVDPTTFPQAPVLTYPRLLDLVRTGL